MGQYGQSKQELEMLINSSEVFYIDPEREYSRYRTAQYQLEENIIKYLYLHRPTDEYDDNADYSLEILETIRGCIKSFKVGTVPFLHYFNHSWAVKKSEAKHKRMTSDRLIGISDADNDSYRKVLRYLNEVKPDMPFETKVDYISEAIERPKERVKEFIYMTDITIQSEEVEDEDGEKESVYEYVPSSVSVEEAAAQKQSSITILYLVQEVFQKQQERLKPILSDALSSEFIPIIERDEINVSLEYLSEEMLQNYRKTKKVLSQKEIAEKYGRDEASISRTVKTFFAKVKEILKQEGYRNE